MAQKTKCINGELEVHNLVISTADDEYAHLVGYVKEIRPLGTSEQDTDNDEDDVYVDFSYLQYSPNRIREIENMFTALRGQPQKFENLPLDEVIMSPDCLIKITEINNVDLEHLMVCEANAAEYCNAIINDK